MHIFYGSIGIVLLLFASVVGAVSMNFQKLAQHLTHWHDPRTRKQPRELPLTSPVYFRALFIIAMLLSASGAVCDFLALVWLSPTTVGIMGCLSILINRIVSSVLLHESLERTETFLFLFVFIGCAIAIGSDLSAVENLNVHDLLSEVKAKVFIISTWAFACSFKVLINVSRWSILKRVGPPVLSGIVGSQMVCGGKYVAWALSNDIIDIHSLLPMALLCIIGSLVHIAWLNETLANYEATTTLVLFQLSWFIWNVVSGIVIFNNMQGASTERWMTFVAGWIIAISGVTCIVRYYHNKTTQSLA